LALGEYLSVLALVTLNTRLTRKKLGTNTLAYFAAPSATKKTFYNSDTMLWQIESGVKSVWMIRNFRLTFVRQSDKKAEIRLENCGQQH
jgi:hypothetical protein